MTETIDKEQVNLLALTLVDGLGPVSVKNLISYIGSASKVMEATVSKLKSVPGIGQKLLKDLKTANAEEAEKLLKNSIEKGITPIFYYDSAYPKKLKQIPDAPVVLFHKGVSALNNPKTIGIVGTRNSSAYGKDFTEHLVKDLAPFNPLIVSGLAYGIDIAAHKSSLKHGLETLAVMGSGHSYIYPAEHRSISVEITKQGGLLSEYPYYVRPERNRFPARNRLIAGLCDAVVVVEAGSRGGALITADFANDYNREVFALPGDISRKYSEGCNTLIKKNKAGILTGAEDIIASLNWDLELKKKKSKPVESRNIENLTEEEQRLLKLLEDVDSRHIDDLAWQSQFTTSKLASILLSLEFKGIVKSLPGKKYSILSK